MTGQRTVARRSVCRTGLEPLTSRPQAGLRLTRARLASDRHQLQQAGGKEGRRLCDPIADCEAWRRANVRAVPAEVGYMRTSKWVYACTHSLTCLLPY